MGVRIPPIQLKKHLPVKIDALCLLKRKFSLKLFANYYISDLTYCVCNIARLNYKCMLLIVKNEYGLDLLKSY